MIFSEEIDVILPQSPSRPSAQLNLGGKVVKNPYKTPEPRIPIIRTDNPKFKGAKKTQKKKDKPKKRDAKAKEKDKKGKKASTRARAASPSPSSDSESDRVSLTDNDVIEISSCNGAG